MTRKAHAREALLAFISENPGLRRGEIAQRMHKGLNVTSRQLYMLHMTGYIKPSGVGNLTTWEAVENPEPKEAKRYTAAPIQSYAVPFAGANSIFGVFHG